MIDGQLVLGHSIRWGMVGGGLGSQIGYSHRSAALRDGGFQLVAGAFDLDAARGRQFGVKLGVDAERCYPDYRTMFDAEAQRADGIRAVSIATPNNTHFEICRAALNAGLHVVCEPPLCFTTDEAQALQRLSVERNRIVGVAYGYAGYQMIEQAREMIARGDLGEIRIVQMQFAHGFHSDGVEAASAAARWRVDPKFAGPSYVLGDIGTHPLYLSEVMAPELKIRRLMCSRQSFVKSRAPLEDNAFTLMEYDTGAIGYVWSSAVNAGSMHGQKVRVIGSKASVEWWDEHPNQLRYEIQGSRRSCSIVQWAICIRTRYAKTASAPGTRKGCSTRGRTCMRVSRSRWTRPIAAMRRHCGRFVFRTSMRASKACGGSRTACAPPTRAACGSTIVERGLVLSVQAAGR
jgi:predicted dehydrogenase